MSNDMREPLLVENEETNLPLPVENNEDSIIVKKQEEILTNRPKAVLFMNLAQVLMIVYMALMKELQADGIAALDICLLRSAFGFLHAFSVLKWRGESFWPKTLSESPEM